jgi:hypothetical protein
MPANKTLVQQLFTKSTKKKEMGLTLRENTYRIFLYVITLIFVIFALVIVLVSLFRSSAADNVIRFCFRAEPGNVVGGPGEPGAVLYGYIKLDTNDNSISYAMQDNGAISAIQSLVIHGPMMPGSNVGAVLFSLCGAPNMVTVCDVLSVPGAISGSMLQLQPGSLDPRPIILQIRQNPSFYYLEVLTASVPASPGALRADLISTCGFE